MQKHGELFLHMNMGILYILDIYFVNYLYEFFKEFKKMSLLDIYFLNLLLQSG